MTPKVIIHNAVSLDGRTTGFEVDMARFYALGGTWKEDVTLAGADTILAAPEGRRREKPMPVAPPAAGPGALLAIVDSRGRVGCWGMLRDSGFWRGVVALGARMTPARQKAYLARRGVELLVCGHRRVDLRQGLDELARRYGAKTVRLESGGALNQAALEQGVVSEVSMVVHPIVVGGDGPSFLGGFRGPLGLRLIAEKRLPGGLCWLRYRA